MRQVGCDSALLTAGAATGRQPSQPAGLDATYLLFRSTRETCGEHLLNFDTVSGELGFSAAASAEGARALHPGPGRASLGWAGGKPHAGALVLDHVSVPKRCLVPEWSPPVYKVSRRLLFLLQLQALKTRGDYSGVDFLSCCSKCMIDCLPGFYFPKSVEQKTDLCITHQLTFMPPVTIVTEWTEFDPIT